MATKRVRFGKLHADAVDFAGAIEAIAKMVSTRRGGYVVTPNVDHVVLGEKNQQLEDAYRAASLSLVDGMPLLWLSQLMGEALPGKISGSDLTEPLLKKAAQEKWRVYFLGGAPGVGQLAEQKLRQRIAALNVVGIDAPPLGFEQNTILENAALDKVVASKADLLLVALGCPKQELLMYRWQRAVAPTVMLGIGGTLDFIAGVARRAPPWMSRLGLEWTFRLAQDPRRFAHRYLVRDVGFIRIALQMLRADKKDRTYSVDQPG